MNKLNISPRANMADLCGLLCVVCSLLLRRCLLGALSVVRIAAKWLKTRHNFALENDVTPIIMTGYQFSFFFAVCCFVFIVLSIEIY